MTYDDLCGLCLAQSLSDRLAFLRQPFQLGGQVVAADSVAMLAVNSGLVAGYKSLKIKQAGDELPAATVKKLLALPAGERHTTLAALKQLVGEYVGPDSKECPGCACGYCEGGEYVEPPPSRKALLCCAKIDLNLLARQLRLLSGDCPVTVAVPIWPSKDETPFVFDGDGWRIVLRPMNKENKSDVDLPKIDL